VKECANIMISRPGLIEAMRRIVARVHAGELDVSSGSRALLVERDIRGPRAGEPAPFPDLFAHVEGTKDGEFLRVGVSPLAIPEKNMGEITGIPAAIVTAMIAKGEITRRGVMAPEAAVEPMVFFERLAAFANEPAAGDLVDIARENGAAG
jgi:hypothetical protein